MPRSTRRDAWLFSSNYAEAKRKAWNLIEEEFSRQQFPTTPKQLRRFFYNHKGRLLDDTRQLRASPLRRRALLHSSPPCANGQSARSGFLYKRGVRPSKGKSSLGCRPEHIDSRPRIRGDELLRVLT
ncbi:unnamed protein product [Trichogramma brassicae]|uniref:Uncharacterized protein n=1 Tax=Trichogramma brassicae TaxID=86971 RepID=A0A6H5ICI0_9HYME|nr:unnamed protein product [Trichogramma brassicae]